MDNRHNRAIPQDVLEDLTRRTREINEILRPYATPLTTQERQERIILGDKSIAFGEKSYNYAVANPKFVPEFVDTEEFGIDMADTTGLRVLRNNLNQAFETVDDLMLLSGSEAYQTALAFYSYIKLLVAQDVPGAKAIYEELKKRFPGRGKSKKDVEGEKE
jgi:hypothetical protein